MWTTSSILRISASHNPCSEPEARAMRVLALCCTDGRMSGTVGQKWHCCARNAGDSSITKGRLSWKVGWGRRETEMPLPPSVSWHKVLAGFEFIVKHTKKGDITDMTVLRYSWKRLGKSTCKRPGKSKDQQLPMGRSAGSPVWWHRQQV